MGVLEGETCNFAWGQPKMRRQEVTLELGVKDMQGVSQLGKRWQYCIPSRQNSRCRRKQRGPIRPD